MLLQTNSYVVPKEKRSEHARLVRRFKQCLSRLGCEDYEVYEQVGNNWTSDQTGGRFVQIMRFRDRRHQLAVQAAEKTDPVAQAIIAEFCNLVNFPYQQQQGLFAVGYYTSLLAATQKALPHVPSGATAAAEASSIPQEPVPANEMGEVPMVAEPLVREAPPSVSSPASPFADGEPVVEPLVEESRVEDQPAESEEHLESGRNGDSVEHATTSADEPSVQPAHVDAAALDELIKQRFGAVEVGPMSHESPDEPPAIETHIPQPQSVEAPIAEPHVSEPIFSSSGIGEVLDASLGEDPDFDFVLPAELLTKHIEEKAHQAQESVPENRHVSHPEHN